jgi:hypothetical protein
LDGVKGFNEGWSLPPWHVRGSLEHVVSVPSRNWDEWDLFWVVTNLLDEVRNFVLDFIETSFREVYRLFVHLVNKDDHLLDTKGVSEESVLSGLSVLSNTSFELTSW